MAGIKAKADLEITLKVKNELLNKQLDLTKKKLEQLIKTNDKLGRTRPRTQTGKDAKKTSQDKNEEKILAEKRKIANMEVQNASYIESKKKKRAQAEQQRVLKPETNKKDAKQQENNFQSMRNELMLSGISEKKAISATNTLKKNMSDLGFTMKKNGDFFNESTNQTIGFNKAAGYLSRSVMPKFHGQFLSLMFIGQGMSATFGGMIQSALQSTGIFEAFGGVLQSILLPVLMPLIMRWLPKLMKWLESPGAKEFAAQVIIMGSALGTTLSMISQVVLLLGSLGFSLKDIGLWFKNGPSVISSFFKGLKNSWILIKTAFKSKGLLAGLKLGFKSVGQSIAKWLPLINGVVGGLTIFWGILTDNIWPVLKGIILVIGAILTVIFGWPAALAAAIVGVVLMFDKFALLRGIIYSITAASVSWLSALELIGQAVGKIFKGDWKGLKEVFSMDNMLNNTLSGKLVKSAAYQFQAVQKEGIGAKSTEIDLQGNLKNIPKMASGGIVNDPTLAVIGEAGPEAVIPLSSNNSNFAGNKEIYYNPTINVNVSGGSFNEQDLADKINKALYDALQRGI